MPSAWAIKLGSGGICVPFCEEHGIVGVGWRDIDSTILQTGTRETLWQHVREVYPDREAVSDRWVGAATGQLWRFARECVAGDYVLYYDPTPKHVRVCRVTSPAKYRDFETEGDVDIWHYRSVEYPVGPIPLLDFYGGLKGTLLGPRMSFWSLGSYEKVDQIARGLAPNVVAAPDAEITAAYGHLRDLFVRRLEALQDQDWEWLVVDYLRAQGAHVDERAVGGSRAIIDVEARFYHGELPETLWRVQVKRYQDRPVDWPEIDADLGRAGEYDTFMYVSVFGFTDHARREAFERGVSLLEAADFTRFLLSGRLQARLKEKLQLPFEQLDPGGGSTGTPDPR